ncbi:MAG: thermonuclease family protein, partial [Clostridia bacterium]|nr:thermonuclease family protein [Clostridia bacterium]
MKKISKLFISILTVTVLALPMLCTACGGNDDSDKNGKDPVDYVSSLTLDLTSNTKKQEVTVRNYIDGDTTHFDPVKNSTLTGYNAADFAETQGYIKARYLAINTPESTGKIEPWGKKASNFTRSKLENAQSIIVESDDDKWNIDSTGERYTLWIWYQPKGETETAYRNLNVEILQEGLALPSSVVNNRYGTIASNAVMQANDLGLYVHSDEKDPDYPYGAATPVTLKELRCNIADYDGQKVKVEGVVTSEYSNSVYIE